MIEKIKNVISLWEADLTVGEIICKIDWMPGISRIDVFCILFLGYQYGMPLEMIERGLANIQPWMLTSDAKALFERDAGYKT